MVFWLTAATQMTGCGSDRLPRAQTEEPFSYAEIEALGAPIEQLGSNRRVAALKALRNNLPEVERQYRDRLLRFELIYGDGVGAAKHSAQYGRCKAVLRRADDRLGAPLGTWPLGETRRLWGALQQCRRAALHWGQPVEMATFGSDLRAVATGAMLALGIAASTEDMPEGPQLFREATLPPP